MKATDTITTAPLAFNCSCRGCRGYSPDIAGIVHPSQLASREQGYYFTPGAMRFFNSRLGNWRRLDNPAAGKGRDNRDGVAVIVSSRYDTAPRHYEVVRVCAWGQVHRQEGETGLDKCDTLNAANKLLAAATYPGECLCHGCQLDRAYGVNRKRN